MKETKSLTIGALFFILFYKALILQLIRESKRMVRRSELLIDVAQGSLTRRTDGITAVLSIYKGGDEENGTNKVV